MEMSLMRSSLSSMPKQTINCDHAVELFKLGSGSFSTVSCMMESEQGGINLPVIDGASSFGPKIFALKSYKTSSGLSPDRHKRIQMELMVMQALQGSPSGLCPYIAHMLPHTRDADRDLDSLSSVPISSSIKLAMEPVLGGELHRHLAVHGGYLPVEIATIYCAEIVAAVIHLRNHRIIHRDIKLKNCLLDHTGHIKLCDFGSAIVFPVDDMTAPSTTSSSSHCRAFSLVGTPHAMAPEVSLSVLRTRGYSFPVDWFAVGALLLELLSGVRLQPAVDSNSDTLPSPEQSTDAVARDSAVRKQVAASLVSSLGLGLNSTGISSSTSSTSISSVNRNPSGPRSQADSSSSGSSLPAPEGLRQLLARQASDEELFVWLRANIRSQITSARVSEAARALLLSLLEPDATLRLCDGERIKRHALFSASSDSSAIHTRSSSHLLSEGLSKGVDWSALEAGAYKPADEGFDRRVGYLEALEIAMRTRQVRSVSIGGKRFESDQNNHKDSEDELTAEQQALFEGF